MKRRWIGLVVLGIAASGCERGESAKPSDADERPFDALSEPEQGSTAGTTGARSAPEVPADAPLVVFLGDSIAAGLHLDPADAFPAVLQRELAAAGEPFRLVNAGVSGDTTAGGLRRLEWVLEQEPDVLVVELGGNDGLRGQPVADIESRLREIVARAQQKGVRVLLLGTRLPPSLGQDYVRAFEEQYAHIAEELGCAYVPFFMQGAGGVPEMMQDDGLHPNRAGHERIARNLAAPLSELLALVRSH